MYLIMYLIWIKSTQHLRLLRVVGPRAPVAFACVGFRVNGKLSTIAHMNHVRVRHVSTPDTRHPTPDTQRQHLHRRGPCFRPPPPPSPKRCWQRRASARAWEAAASVPRLPHAGTHTHTQKHTHSTHPHPHPHPHIHTAHSTHTHTHTHTHSRARTHTFAHSHVKP
jgi:hypothetical protein